MLQTDLRLAQFVLQGLDGALPLLHLCTGVLQLCLQELGGLFVVGDPAVGFRLGLLQLPNLDMQSLENRKTTVAVCSS